MVYKNLTDDDLKAIFAFLRTTKPVKHRVDNSEAPTECKLCKQKHGSAAKTSIATASAKKPGLGPLNTKTCFLS
jgi:hypothetical protein